MTSSAAAVPTATVTVYWRPGCGFCSGLFRSLERFGVDHERVNIWDSEEAAATVRSIANGNETVPTVTVQRTVAEGTDPDGVGMVNPTVHQVLGALVEIDPSAIPEGYTAPEPGRMAKMVGKLLGDG